MFYVGIFLRNFEFFHKNELKEKIRKQYKILRNQLNPLFKVNIPLMRQNELINGIAIYDEQGNRAGTSKLAAKIGISQVNR